MSGFDVTVGVTRSFMRLTGAWPNLHGNGHWLSRYYFILPLSCMSIFTFIPQTAMAIYTRSDLEMLLEILNVGLIFVGLSIFKLLAANYTKKGTSFLFKINSSFKAY